MLFPHDRLPNAGGAVTEPGNARRNEQGADADTQTLKHLAPPRYNEKLKRALDALIEEATQGAPAACPALSCLALFSLERLLRSD
jgi:hypothetical protein